MTTDGLRVNDTATYACLAGHRLRAGSLTKVCGETGDWQNKDPECIGETGVWCHMTYALNVVNIYYITYLQHSNKYDTDFILLSL